MTISFGYILCCVCFNLYCGGFTLFCDVWVCGFCNVWVCVCVGFVMCGGVCVCVCVYMCVCVYVCVCVCGRVGVVL